MILASDTFTGTTNTPLTLHTMNVGTGWIADPIFDATLKLDGSGSTVWTSGNSGSLTDVVTGDGTMSVEVTVPTGFWLLNGHIRYIDSTHRIYWGVSRSGSGPTSISMIGVNGTDVTTFASTVVSDLSGTTFNLTATCHGDTISLQAGTESAATGTWAFGQTGSKFGIGVYGLGLYASEAPTVLQDNFSFESAELPTLDESILALNPVSFIPDNDDSSPEDVGTLAATFTFGFGSTYGGSALVPSEYPSGTLSAQISNAALSATISNPGWTDLSIYCVHYVVGTSSSRVLWSNWSWGSGGDGAAFYYTGSKLVFKTTWGPFNDPGVGVEADFTPVVGTVYEFGVTIDGTTHEVVLYVNGEPIGSGTAGAITNGLLVNWGGTNGVAYWANGLLAKQAIFASVLSDTDFSDLHDAFTGPPATTYTITGEDDCVSGFLYAVTVTPTGVAGMDSPATVTITPSGGGLDAGDAQNVVFDNTPFSQTIYFRPTEEDEITFTGTNDASLINPSPLVVDCEASDAHAEVADVPHRVIAAATKLTVVATHVGNPTGNGIVSVEMSFDNFSTTEDTQTTETLNDYWANDGTGPGLKSAGILGYTFAIAPSMFASSGSKTIYFRTNNIDGSQTNITHLVVIDKTGALSPAGQGYISPLGLDANNGTSLVTPRLTLGGGAGITVTTNDNFAVGMAAGGYAYDFALTTVANSTGWLTYQPNVGLSLTAVKIENDAVNVVPDTDLISFANLQIGANDSSSQYWPVLVGTNAAGSALWIKSVLFQGLGNLYLANSGLVTNQFSHTYLTDLTYDGVNGTWHPNVAINSMFTGCTNPISPALSGGQVMVNIEVQNCVRPDPNSTFPIDQRPSDVHSDVYFAFGLWDKAYIQDAMAIVGPWEARCWKMGGDGIVRYAVTFRRSYTGTCTNGMWDCGSDITYVERGYFVGANDGPFENTRKRRRIIDSGILPVGFGIWPPTSEWVPLNDGEHYYTPGGRVDMPVYWQDAPQNPAGAADGEITAVMVKAVADAVVINDVAGFIITGSTTPIVVTDVTYLYGHFRFAYTGGPPLATDDLVLEIDEAAYSVGGVDNDAQSVPFVRNYSPLTTSELTLYLGDGVDQAGPPDIFNLEYSVSASSYFGISNIGVSDWTATPPGSNWSLVGEISDTNFATGDSEGDTPVIGGIYFPMITDSGTGNAAIYGLGLAPTVTFDGPSTAITNTVADYTWDSDSVIVGGTITLTSDPITGTFSVSDITALGSTGTFTFTSSVSGSYAISATGLLPDNSTINFNIFTTVFSGYVPPDSVGSIMNSYAAMALSGMEQTLAGAAFRSMNFPSILGAGTYKVMIDNGIGIGEANVLASVIGTVTAGTPLDIDLTDIPAAGTMEPIVLTGVKGILIQETSAPIGSNYLLVGDSSGALTNAWRAPWTVATGQDRVGSGGAKVRYNPLGYTVDSSHKILRLNADSGIVLFQLDIIGTA